MTTTVFLTLSTMERFFSGLSDGSTFVRTLHKMQSPIPIEISGINEK